MRSSELRGYLTGLVLGDGHIDRGVQKRAFSIKSINEDFIDKIINDLSSCTNFHISKSSVEAYIDKYGVNHKKYFEIRIKAHPYFSKKYPYFYTDTKKRRITNESLSWLNLAGFANWYMSDGYICLVGKTKGKIKDRRVELCTDRYTKGDVEKVSKYFNDTFGWKNSVVKRGNLYRIRFSLMYAQDMFVKILPYMTESFYYKLDLKYDIRPRWMSDEYYNLIPKIQKREHPTGDMI